jgi:patatin-like phospholipase/acyl hydrolase
MSLCTLSLMVSLTSNHRTDGGGIRGLSELIVIKEVMHRLMVEENAKRKKDGEQPLSSLPKPCDYFDLIGGTSTGGCVALYTHHPHITRRLYEICALQDNCFNAWASSDGCRHGNQTLRSSGETSLLR